MTELSDINVKGVATYWPTRKTIIRGIEKAIPESLDRVRAYNARTDSNNTLNVPPVSYGAFGMRLRGKAEVLALKGQSWEREMLDALEYIAFNDQISFFWHIQFRIIFPEHPQPLRMMNWERTTETMAMFFLLGCIDNGVYEGYLTHSALNRGYQLQLSYEDKHRCAHAFMLRLFSAWRGDVKHEWPPFAFSEPIYEGILERWRIEDPDVLKPWLLAACDRHTHESKTDTEKKFYDWSTFERIPLEILLLFRLRELVGLRNPVLDHPLMEFPFDKLPEPQAASTSDEIIRGTLARIRTDWPQFDDVVSLDALRAQ